ncbi:MAG TPA: putative toxin-antitoxin system toxin component, PIN family [Thermomicrobiales bacterium]|nr:putative toxin-antitoxin system toxin component, PIN family [Thermomicrobiales bacterium]
MRVVLDTNVIVSRHLTDGGTPWMVLSRWDSGDFTLLISGPLLAELHRILRYRHLRPLHGLEDHEIDHVVALMKDTAELVETAQSLQFIIHDPSDNMVLECAVAGGADVIVTGDKKHLLPLGSYSGIPIVSPAGFLAMLDAQGAR